MRAYWAFSDRAFKILGAIIFEFDQIRERSMNAQERSLSLYRDQSRLFPADGQIFFFKLNIVTNFQWDALNFLQLDPDVDLKVVEI